MSNTRQYTAADFARYHAGTMPAGEMHALEKAALDDPFLGDALEGFAVTPSASSDAAHLRERISDAVSAKKVFFLSPKRGWWRIAALLIIMAGAGYLFFTVNSHVSRQNNFAKNEKAKEVNAIRDSVAGAYTWQDTAAAGKAHLNENTGSAATITSSDVTIPSVGSITWSGRHTAPAANDHTIAPQADLSAAVTSPPVNAAADESAKYDFTQSAPLNYYQNSQSNKPVNDVAGNNINNNALSNNAGYNNIYQKDQNGISAAPIANAADKKTIFGANDDREKFSLNVADSTMFAKAKPADKSAELLKVAPGMAAQIALADSNAVATTALGIKRGRKELASASTTLSNVDIANVPVRKSAAKNSEVELSGNVSLPSAGQTPAEKAAFDKYIKETMQPVYNQAGKRMTGEVLLSFNVKKGRPKNVRVAMSLCPPCEAQAMQLLENGPDWSGKKNEEKTVIIKF